MNPRNYLGQELSLLELAFALNEGLKPTVYSPSHVEKDHGHVRERRPDFFYILISQLHHAVLTALAAICEQKNSFAPINRIPFDILSLHSSLSTFPARPSPS